ncbi:MULTISPECIES: DUF6265 family protein [unclassified Sphingomonas]|uniref:DUF6265 family protein n=1 Tax=Novosphingobium rhizosphaerae TaxID=1551649 RepID=UPI0015CE2984
MLMILAAIASTLPQQVNGLSWMAGHWLECTPRHETSEIWTDARGDVMLGVSKSVRGNRADWEFARIEIAPEGLTFFAHPKGQAPTSFRAISVGPGQVIFENIGHDFPQRVIYTRHGNRLTGRIEGIIEGQARSIEWNYTAAPLNAACPAMTQ